MTASPVAEQKHCRGPEIDPKQLLFSMKALAGNFPFIICLSSLKYDCFRFKKLLESIIDGLNSQSLFVTIYHQHKHVIFITKAGLLTTLARSTKEGHLDIPLCRCNITKHLI